MSKHVERTITASLTARELAVGVWQLSSATPGGVDIILRGADSEARAALTGIRATRAVVAWQRNASRDGAVVTLTTPGGTRHVHARTVILHEPQALLYDQLPLVRLDERARRFWRRVFCLVLGRRPVASPRRERGCARHGELRHMRRRFCKRPPPPRPMRNK
jgi:hypothetical protein